MTKRFVIGTDPLTDVQVRELKDAFKGAGWWYWIPNFWLVKDSSGELTASTVRDKIRQVNSDIRCLVLEVEPVTWSAMTKKDSKGRGMTDWIKKTWDE